MSDRLCMGCMKKYSDAYNACPYCGFPADAGPQEPYHLTPGTIIGGKYIVGRAVGYGGFSVTYIGYDYSIEKRVAIKEYLPSEFATRSPGTSTVSIFSGDKAEQFHGGIEKFVDEAKRLARFRGTPGVTEVYDVVIENNTAYIVMEFLEGETLKRYLEREGRIAPERAVSMMLPIIRTLEQVHAQGLLHRDISPDNIFLTSSGEVKLIDFGAARQATSTSHSKSLSVIVTPGYAPPEQYRSRGEQGSWTDAYGCGAVLYKMITGITPEDSMDRSTKDNLEDVSRFSLDIPENIENAIMNALNLEIEERTPDMQTLFYELTTQDEVARIKVKKKKVDFGRWPLWMKISVPAALACVAILGTLIATGVINWRRLIPNYLAKTRVPNVVNQTVDDAQKIAGNKNLTFQIVDKVESDTIPKDMVLAQNIPVNTEVQEKMILEVVISAGAGQAYMPDLTGFSQDEAEKQLKELGLFAKTDTSESEILKDYVCAQEYEPGQAVDKGTEVGITISTGMSSYDTGKTTTVPKFVGSKWDDARSTAKSKSLYIYKTSAENSDTAEKGEVTKQDTKEKTSVNAGTPVGVDVSLGVNMTHVPDVVYKKLSDAEKLMSKNKLKVELTYENSTVVAKDRIISQSIASGEEVKVWTTVTLHVSLGDDSIKDAPVYEQPTDPDDYVEVDDTEENPTTREEYTKDPDATTEDPDEDPYDPGYDDGSDDPQDTESTESTENPGNDYNWDDDAEDGIDITEVPSVIGMTYSEAVDALTDAGIVVGQKILCSRAGSPDGEVLEQSIVSGALVEVGTEMDLSVCDNSTITKYRYRDVVDYSYTSSESSSAPSGYKYYKTDTRYSYSDWSGWTDWGPNYIAGSDTCNVESQSGAVFGVYVDAYNGGHDKDIGGCTRYEYYRPWSWVMTMTEHNGTAFNWPGSTTDRYWIPDNSSYVCRNVMGSGEWTWQGTVYRCQTRQKIEKKTYWYRKPIWGSWSGWSESTVYQSDTREVEMDTQYVYQGY